MLNAELRLTIPQVLRGYTDVINNSDGFIYSIYYMEKCLYAKDIIHLPVLPLKHSSGNLSAGLIVQRKVIIQNTSVSVQSCCLSVIAYQLYCM